MNWKQGSSYVAVAAALTGFSNAGTDLTGADDVSTTSLPETTHHAFLDNLRELCGRAFAGHATGPSAADSGLSAERLAMHVRHCSEDEIQIPLHIGSNRSRTWLVTRTKDGLRLKHDHRLPDGKDDAVTQYGGDTAKPGTAREQSFPADAFTAELIPDSATNVWTMTIDPGKSFTYHLARHGAPRATFTFDLTQDIEPPPAPWGYEDTRP